MKKIFFAAILSTMLIAPAFSYTRYEVPTMNSRYIFDIYDQGETVNFLDESFTSTYNLTNNQMNALFDAAKNGLNILISILMIYQFTKYTHLIS